jgi:DNA replication and repair protein RecF
MQLEYLDLSNFRSYASLRQDNFSPSFNILYGANGAGKTNILEAISLLSPGRGMRGATLREIGKMENELNLSWAINAKVKNKLHTEISTGCILDTEESDKRILRIDNKLAKNQGELNRVFNVVWLTPQMDRILSEGASSRRKFLDRLVASFDALHTERVTNYTNAWKERSELIKLGNFDKAWLAALEEVIAQHAVAIASARIVYVEKINQLNHTRQTNLPKNIVQISGLLETKIAMGEKLSLVEDEYRAYLSHNRTLDFCGQGIQHSDMNIIHHEKKLSLSFCSTGEQKLMLISLVLAHAEMIKLECAFTPILLLDEVGAHLDAKKLAAVISEIIDLKGQTFITGIEKHPYVLAPNAHFFKVEHSNLVLD